MYSHIVNTIFHGFKNCTNNNNNLYKRDAINAFIQQVYIKCILSDSKDIVLQNIDISNKLTIQFLWLVIK